MTNFFFLHLLPLILSLKVYILHISAQHIPSMNDEVLGAIRDAYYSSIVNSTGIALTQQELNSYLLRIIQSQTPPSTVPATQRSVRTYNNFNNIDMSCKPSPYILSSDEVFQALIQTSNMRSIVTDIVTNHTCIPLQRCSVHSGCCQGNATCSAIRRATILIPIKVRVLATLTELTEIVPFSTDEECSCVSKIDLCICAAPFVSSLSEDEYSCNCSCPPNDEACQNISSGRSRINDWNSLSTHWSNKTLPETRNFYKKCIHQTKEGLHHLTSLYCPPLPCLSGKTFNFTSGTCEDIINPQLQQLLNSQQSAMNSESRTTQSYSPMRSSTARASTSSLESTDLNSGQNSSDDALLSSQPTTSHSFTTSTQRTTSVTRENNYQPTTAETGGDDSQQTNSTEMRSEPSQVTNLINGSSLDMLDLVLESWNPDLILKYVKHRGVESIHSDMRIMRKISKGFREFCVDYRAYCAEPSRLESFSYAISATRLIAYQCTIQHTYCQYISSVNGCTATILNNTRCENVDSRAVRHGQGRLRHQRH